MPQGFIGKASETYLTNVTGALSAAHAVHSKDPFGNVPVGVNTPPALSSRNNLFAKYSPDTAHSGGYVTGIGNESNIVVDEQTYEEILQRIRMTDEGIAQDLHELAVQIEQMCQTIYIVPATLPKYLAIVDKVKSSLGEFQSLAEQAGTKAYEFMGEIKQIDGKQK